MSVYLMGFSLIVISSFACSGCDFRVETEIHQTGRSTCNNAPLYQVCTRPRESVEAARKVKREQAGSRDFDRQLA
jgi:hypothetical protein